MPVKPSKDRMAVVQHVPATSLKVSRAVAVCPAKDLSQTEHHSHLDWHSTCLGSKAALQWRLPVGKPPVN